MTIGARALAAKFEAAGLPLDENPRHPWTRGPVYATWTSGPVIIVADAGIGDPDDGEVWLLAADLSAIPETNPDAGARGMHESELIYRGESADDLVAAIAAHVRPTP
jgi:hypothetical protein